MASEWPEIQLGELVKRGEVTLQTGPFGSQLHKHDYIEHGVPVVPTEAIGHGLIVSESVLPQITEKKATELKRHALQRGDILFARRGAQATGLSAYVDDAHVGALCGTGAILLRLRSAALDPKFIASFLATNEAFEWLRANAVGAVMPNLNTGIISQLVVPVPPLWVQREIGITSSVIENRIQLLRNQNTTLEAIAQTLFKSWFVDFDPVRAKAEGREPDSMDAATAALFPDSFEDSPLGPIPQGWHASSLTDCMELNPKRVLRKGSLASYLDMANAPTQGHRPSGIAQRELGSGSKFINGDTLLAKITPCLENGKTAFVDFLADNEVGWGSTEFIVMRPKAPLSPFWGYLLARMPSFRTFAIQAMTGTSGRQRVDLGSLKQFSVVMPNVGVAKAFEKIIEPLRARIAAASSHADSLSELRDTLLPRLISGKLRLPEAQALIEDATP